MIRYVTQLAQKARVRVVSAFSGSVDPSVAQVRAVALSVMLLVSLVVVGGAMAQFTGTWQDDFEDDTVGEIPAGWTSSSPTAEVQSTTGGSGSQSLFIESSSSGDSADNRIRWNPDGPELNMSQEFTIQMTVRHDISNPSNNNAATRIGVASDDTTATGQNAFILFAPNVNETGLGTQNDYSQVTETMPGAFTNEWVNVELSSDGNGTLTAKVWALGESEPASPQLSQSITGASGRFGVQVGSRPNDVRSAWVDDVTIEGTTETPESETLELDVQRYMAHGTTQDYRVLATVNTSTGNETADVTDSATVSSSNTSVITVDEQAQTLNATSNTSINDRVAISATYQGQTASENVTVANATLDNAQILPGTWRATAMISDDTIFFLIIVAMIMGVIGRYATAFAGLGMGQLAVAIGWWGGYVPEGVAMVSVFLVLFIGFNLAVNVDYTVQR